MRVIPEVLNRVGAQLADHGDHLLAVQQACRGQIEDAHGGWVGASAGALSALLDGWARASSAHLDCFGHHAAGMQLAAAAFTELDQRTAGALR
ncbi:hypothetical protein BST27_25950 [Mycobacterium intermedium]|uniref:WXG100 family type VII secretion target n=1 Tax=Mycobacterium intermedium TaxID=28445 RepID=A0A1E3SHD5_MYCIE|nr:WXG100 family type VII secretion target [Mycobacterium intermedium]ODR01576.1 hypothetical protein BHQ20_08535 [Mycobacterium intermedium]OPE46881.1 hypothetical protein BV508_24285 [Mycobacterium intermedium]ORA96369.1 hypothetical protein BST27_25950 [Mycobacterium intermedium]